jgi:hypothetical protein
MLMGQTISYEQCPNCGEDATVGIEGNAFRIECGSKCGIIGPWHTQDTQGEWDHYPDGLRGAIEVWDLYCYNFIYLN